MRQIPFVEQLTPAECGAACLAMVLGLHGRPTRLADIRPVVGAGCDGTTALGLVEAASFFGLEAQGIRIDPDELEQVPAGTILHWKSNHFLVFESIEGDQVTLVDPAAGRRQVSRVEFARAATGVAVLLEPRETFTRTDAEPRPIWRVLRRVLRESGDWRRIIAVSVVLQLFAMALPLLTGAVVDTIVPHGDRQLLRLVAVGLAALVAAQLFASAIRAHLLIRLRTTFESRLTRSFVEHLVRLPLAFFRERPAGDLSMRFNSNSVIRDVLVAGTLSLLDGTLVLIYLVAMFVVSPWLAALVLLLALLQGVVFWFQRSGRESSTSDTLQAQTKAESYFVEMLAGMVTLKSSGAEERSAQQWWQLFADQLDASRARSRRSALVEAVNGTLRLVSPLLILACGALQALDGTMSLGTLLAFCALAGAFLSPISHLVTTASHFQLLGSYIDRLEDVLGSAPEQAPDAPRVVHQARGRITLDDVSFSYSRGRPPALSGVSLDIAPGQLVAIVGRSGSGKSTLGNLLLGLYPPDQGRILYDGVDLATIDLPSLRRQLGVVNQDSYVFGSTIRDNITFGASECPAEAVIDAARRAQLDADVRAMPMGYETMLVGGGAPMSGGERQRVVLARALLRRPAILLLDEATSALDAVTEKVIQDELATLSCTRIVIAHRLSTIRHADKILVLDRGRLVEHGTHVELMALSGVYAGLVAAQVDPALRSGAER